MRSFRKILFWIVLLLLIITGAYFGIRYFKYSKDPDPYKTFLIPKVELSEFEILNLNSKKTELMAKMLIRNQMPIGFKADSIDYKFYIEQEEVFKSSYRNSISIKGSDSSWIMIPITVFAEKLITILKKSEQKGLDSADYEIKSNFYTNYTFNKKIKIDIKRRLPLFHMLDVKVVRVEIDSFRLSGATLLVHTKIANKNVFDLKLKDINYRFAIAGNEWVEGIKPGPVNLLAHSVSDVTMPLKISFKEVWQTIFELIKKGKKIDYKMEARFKIYPDNSMMKNSKAFITSAGTLNEVMDLVKDQKKLRKKLK